MTIQNKSIRTRVARALAYEYGKLEREQVEVIEKALVFLFRRMVTVLVCYQYHRIRVSSLHKRNERYDIYDQTNRPRRCDIYVVYLL